MIRFKITLCIALLCYTINALAQLQNSGRIVSYSKTKNGIAGKTVNFSFEVSAYSANIIRVQITKNQEINDYSFALVSNEKPSFNAFKVADEEGKIKLSTANIKVEIDKAPDFRIVFKNDKGEIINEDMPGKGMGTTFIGDKTTVYKRLQQGERFVGMGESLGNLDRYASVVTTWNVDNYKYDNDKIPMYISIPFYIGIFKDQVYGMYYDNSFKGTFNFGASNTRFSSVTFDGGDMDYFFMYDQSVAKVIEHYISLTGKMPLPPKWSIGYHQSRNSYYPESQVMFIANTFRNKKIPLDCIVLDADYLVDYEPFRINTKRFPDMKGMASRLSDMGIELTASVNPGIKIDATYSAYNDGLRNDIFLRYTDNELYKADIWPNMNYYPDFTNPKARQWWADQMKIYQDVGINGYWNDMNEPAIGGQSMPDNVVFDYDGRKSTPLESHNLYGFLMARSSFESFQKYGGNKRRFVMTRSAFAGIQRFATVWSGDNQAKDEHILLGVLLNNQMGLSGIPFVGPDLGGYIGEATKEMYTRWVEVGVFSPYLRNHRGQYQMSNEPWAYGEEAEAISKTYIEFRYQMMPYLYSKFYETSKTGIPIARSLCLDYPFDNNIYDLKYQYQFIFGDAFLISPLTSKEKSKKVYFPKGKWYNIFTDEKIDGSQELLQDFPLYNLPLYVKESAIVPLQSITQSAKEKPTDVLLLHVYNGENNNDFIYYEDDGATLNYQKNNFYRRTIQFNPKNKTLKFTKVEGNYASNFKKIKVILHGFENKVYPKVNDNTAVTKTETIKLIDPTTNLQDVYFDTNFFNTIKAREAMKPQQVFDIENVNSEILINL
ncbi:glycoside hydrolase family 31 protein [Pedobacter sp.]